MKGLVKARIDGQIIMARLMPELRDPCNKACVAYDFNNIALKYIWNGKVYIVHAFKSICFPGHYIAYIRCIQHET